jgi:putative endopeptidase
MEHVYRRLSALICATLCITAALPAEPLTQPVAATGRWGFDLAGMNATVKPGDDFFSYANGKWVENEPMPADRSWIGVVPILRILSEERLKALVASLQARDNAALVPEERQIRALFDAYTDTAGLEKLGLAPATRDLQYINGLKTLDAVARAMGAPDMGTSSLFGTTIGTDRKHSHAYALYVGQSGLGMPDRDYYLKADQSLAATRAAYLKFQTNMLTLAGVTDAERRATAIVALETRIAAAHWPAAERRNPDKTYNPMTIAQLSQYAPGFPWNSFFQAQGLSAAPHGERVVVATENTALPPMAKLFRATPVAVWRDYLTVHYLINRAAYLPERFDNENFNFYGKVLGGRTQQLPRNTRAMYELDNRLGHPLGKLYVAQYFTPATRAKAEALVANLLKAYDADIRQLAWMTPATRSKALEKLHAFTPHIGYPDRWRDYSGLQIARDDLLGDVARSDRFEWHYALNRIDQPVDRNEWDLTPSTVNADYSAELNSIFFPAAILQPPVFDPNADDAVNYGAIGAVIGHEISHGFDDEGSKFDGDGNLRNWWTDADRAAFDARTATLSGQYDAYEGVPGLNVNGKLTLGENIADLAGLTIAIYAYHLSLGGTQAPVLDGFTGDQRLFLAYAQYYRGKRRDDFERQLLLSDPHSPDRYRAIGTPRNLDAWYAAFGVQPGDKYYLPPEQRVRLW